MYQLCFTDDDRWSDVFMTGVRLEKRGFTVVSCSQHNSKAFYEEPPISIACQQDRPTVTTHELLINRPLILYLVTVIYHVSGCSAEI
ncbi:Hypothetical predicted protein [Scomber scombrus]|uniref:Uncharacterized protein n=1 Tax=Scomber scombrus TaxID=13677 RepID=A0AAV1PDE9_SCOSC